MPAEVPVTGAWSTICCGTGCCGTGRRDESAAASRTCTEARASARTIAFGARRRVRLQRVLAAEHVYLQADQRESPLQLESLATLLSRRLPDFDKVRYRTWDELLASLYARADRLIPVCLDEFPYLAQADPALPSLLQRYIDRADGQIAWILCGLFATHDAGHGHGPQSPTLWTCAGDHQSRAPVRRLAAAGVGASFERSGQGIRYLGRRTALLGTGCGIRQSTRSAAGSCLEPAWSPARGAGQVVAR